jgi:hypothetical protein
MTTKAESTRTPKTTTETDAKGKKVQRPRKKKTRAQIAREKTKKNQRGFLKIFSNKMCSITKSCKAANVGRRTFYKWLEDPAFERSVADCKEELKDFGEDQLKTLMSGIPRMDDEDEKKQVGWLVYPDRAAVIFFNKTQNKDRGYIETTETSTHKTPEIIVESEKAAESTNKFRIA